MSELPPNHKEKLIEHIPTAEEVLDLFKELTGGEDFLDKRKFEDEQGLLLWDITLPKRTGAAASSICI